MTDSPAKETDVGRLSAMLYIKKSLCAFTTFVFLRARKFEIYRRYRQKTKLYDVFYPISAQDFALSAGVSFENDETKIN